jgi:hypothetical protein
MKAPPLKKIETCKYCLDYKGDPKPIFPEDMKYARRMADGSYKCRLCIIGDLLKLNGVKK